MERQIDLNRTDQIEVPLTSAEAMDEVTVMANRLAHLEKQILSLQSQNQQLQADAEKAKNAGFHIPHAIWEWLRYLGIAALVILVLAAVEMLRRKLLSKRLERAEPIWFDSEGNTADEADGYAEITKQASKLMADPLFGEASAQSTVVHQPDNDEADSVLEHADVFIAHGRPILAIQLLQNHLADAPTQSPTIWLKLLSLLADEGSETEYDVAVIECNQYFNIKLPSFADAHTPDNSTIEDHPHIVNRLEGAWGSAFAITLLNDLIYNQHSQPREGFARGTFEELFFLKKIAEVLQSTDSLAQSPHLANPKLMPSIVPLAGAAIAAAGNAQSDTALQKVGMPLDTNQEMLLTSDEALSAGVNDTAYNQPHAPSAPSSAQTNTIDWPANPQENVPSNFDNSETLDDASQGTVDYSIDFESAYTTPDETSLDPSLPQEKQPGTDSDWQTSEQTDDFQVSEINYASTELDLNLDASDLEQQALDDQTEDIRFESDFADALEFDQAELASPETKLEIDPDEESNSIDFDWDLPKINKD
jgi:hypothetical protein